jgi:hypothetical protein
MAAARMVAAILFSTMLGSSCGPATRPEVDTAAPSPSPTSPIQTPTRTLTPAQVPRDISTSTRTPSPTFNDTRRAWETAAEATSLAWKNQVIPPTQTAVASFPVRCPVYEPPAPSHGFIVTPWSHELLISPDGNWLAQDCWGNDWENLSNLDGDYLLISNRSGSRSVTVPYKDIFSGTYFSSYQLYVPILFWSPDNQSLYFSRVFCCVDTSSSLGGIDMSVYPLPLYRVDVQTGIWAQIVDMAYYFSISPTGRRLVYGTLEVDWQNKIYIARLNILDLQTGSLITIEHENTLAAGYVVWSADGLQMYYSSVNGPPHDYSSDDPFDYQIFQVDTVSGQRSLLKSYLQSRAVPYPIGFTTDGKLILRLRKRPPGDFVMAEYSTEYLDLTTKQVMTLTPTSSP